MPGGRHEHPPGTRARPRYPRHRDEGRARLCRCGGALRTGPTPDTPHVPRATRQERAVAASDRPRCHRGATGRKRPIARPVASEIPPTGCSVVAAVAMPPTVTGRTQESGSRPVVTHRAGGLTATPPSQEDVHGCCDPRPPQTAAAATRRVRGSVSWIISLRSSAAADGGRCSQARPHPGGTEHVAILGRRGRRPLPSDQAELGRILGWLRSSAAADGGRCRRATGRASGSSGGCDPRPPRTAAAATAPRRSARYRPSRRCDPRPPRTAAAAHPDGVSDTRLARELRSSAAADGGRCRPAPACRCCSPKQSCDPRPPRTAAAAGSRPSCSAPPPGCCDPRPPRTAAAAVASSSADAGP